MVASYETKLIQAHFQENEPETKETVSQYLFWLQMYSLINSHPKTILKKIFIPTKHSAKRTGRRGQLFFRTGMYLARIYIHHHHQKLHSNVSPNKRKFYYLNYEWKRTQNSHWNVIVQSCQNSSNTEQHYE